MKTTLSAAIVSAVVLASIGVVSARSSEQRPTPHRLVFSVAKRVGEDLSPAHVYITNSDGTGRRALTKRPGSYYRVAASPDGRWIAFDGGRAVHVIRPDGSGHKRITVKGGASLAGPRPWSSDGAQLLLLQRREGGGGQFVHVSREGWKTRWLGVCCREYPAWSPDGTRIAFLVQLERIVVTEIRDGRVTSEKRVAAQRSFRGLGAPFWSRTGRRLVLARYKDGLYTIDADGGHERLIARGDIEFSGEASPYEWAPRADKIIFTTIGARRGTTGVHQIEVVNANGTGRTVLAAGPMVTCCDDLGWSPDGRKISFLRNGQIWVMNADGTRERKLTSRGHHLSPSWLPDD